MLVCLYVCPQPFFSIFFNFLHFFYFNFNFLGLFLPIGDFLGFFGNLCLSGPPHPFEGLKVNKNGPKGPGFGPQAPTKNEIMLALASRN